MDVVLAHPPEFHLMPEIVEQAKVEAKKAGVGFDIVEDMSEGFKDADVVYAKSRGRWCTPATRRKAKPSLGRMRIGSRMKRK